jgi:hypothetical protein
VLLPWISSHLYSFDVTVVVVATKTQRKEKKKGRRKGNQDFLSSEIGSVFTIVEGAYFNAVNAVMCSLFSCLIMMLIVDEQMISRHRRCVGTDVPFLMGTYCSSHPQRSYSFLLVNDETLLLCLNKQTLDRIQSNTSSRSCGSFSNDNWRKAFQI